MRHRDSSLASSNNPAAGAAEHGPGKARYFITRSHSARATVVIAAVVGFGAAVVEFRAAVVALLLLHGARYTQCGLL